MTTIAVPLNLEKTIARTPDTADENVFSSPDGLIISDSPDDPWVGSLAYTDLDSRADQAIAQTTGMSTGSTLTSAELNLVFIAAGSSLTLTYTFDTGTGTQNDDAFVILDGSDNNETVDLIATAALDNSKTYTITLPVNRTDTYDIIVAVQDENSAYSTLNLSSMVVNRPVSSSFTGDALDLTNSAAVNSNGGLVNNGTVVNPNYASAGGAGNVATLGTVNSANGGTLVSNAGAPLVGNAGGTLVGNAGGTIVAAGGGNLVGNAGGTIVAAGAGNLKVNPGSSLVGNAGGTLINPTGGGAPVTQAADPNTYELKSVTLPPGESAVSPPTLTAGADTTLTASNSYALAYSPQVAVLSDGEYAVAWSEDSGRNDGTEDVRVELVKDDGTLIKQFVADPGDTTGAGQATVAALPYGQFVVGWADGQSTASGYQHSVHAQIYNADGSANGPEVNISPAGGDQDAPEFASLKGADFVAVWSANTNANAAPHVGTQPEAQIFDTIGQPAAPLVNIPLPTGSGEYSYYQGAVVTTLNSGGFAIAYVFLNEGSGPDSYGTYVDLFDANGNPTTAPIQVNPAGEGVQGLPAVASLSDGDVVVAWLDSTNVTDTQPLATLRLQIVDPTGALVGSAVDVAQVGADQAPSVTALATGGFAVGWGAYTYSGGDEVNPSSTDIMVQLFNADGSAAGSPQFANPGNSFARSPSLAALPGGSLVAASAQGDFSIHTKAFTVSTAPSATVSDHGVGVDGYISGATVFADAQGTGVFAPGDAVATTNAQGQFVLPANASGPLVMTGGTDTSTGLAFTQTYTAPAGSTSITALSTLMQKLMAGGADLGTADAEVSAAFGLSSLTDFTSLDPIASVNANQANGLYALLVDAVVTDTLKLAQAAGASGDLFGKLAAQIAAQPFQNFDVTSVATMQGLGLSGQVATDTAALALASSNALVKQLSQDTGTLSKLTADVAAAENVAQGSTASALAQGVAAGDTSAVIPTYTGANLNAIVGAAEATQAGTPPDIDFTDVTSDTVGYASSTAYSGPVAGLLHQYIWSGQDSVALATALPNTFIKGGPGNDALQVTSGSNVLDGGGGSNFLVGGTGADGGADTFFVDGRGSVVTWSTIVNFHPGDMATIFGFHAGLSTMPMTASDGAAGYTGLTIHSELAGPGTGVDASITFAGISQATSDAHFTYSTGTLNQGTADATDYLLIQYNR